MSARQDQTPLPKVTHCTYCCSSNVLLARMLVCPDHMCCK